MPHCTETPQKRETLRNRCYLKSNRMKTVSQRQALIEIQKLCHQTGVLPL